MFGFSNLAFSETFTATFNGQNEYFVLYIDQITHYNLYIDQITNYNLYIDQITHYQLI